MLKITVFNRAGQKYDVSAELGLSVMEVLRDEDLVEAICGGAASCGTCHIYLRDAWAKKYGSRTEDESYMLESLADFVDVTPHSRLACQLIVDEYMDGLSLDIAPEA